MNEAIARNIIRFTISRFIPRLLGRSRVWHRLFDRAASVVLAAHYDEIMERAHRR